MENEESINLLKKLRTGAKISISKKINKINSVCQEPNSRESVLKTLETVKIKLEEAKEYNNKLKEMTPEYQSLGVWSEDLEKEVDMCETQMLEFFKSDKYKEIDEKNAAELKKDFSYMESIRPLKEEMIKERMEGIKIAIIEKCANKKIEVLTLKLQDAYRGVRGLFGGVNGVQVRILVRVTFGDYALFHLTAIKSESVYIQVKKID